MKILIIDNEANQRATARAMVQAFCPEIDMVEEADGVQTGLLAINRFQPDMVLLDVEMDDGTGFDLMRQVTDPLFQLVFVTAHNKYAIEAFKFSAIDYLLKPVDPEALQRCIKKAAERLKAKDLGKQIEFLLKQVSGKPDADKRIVLKDIDNVYFVKVADILFCEAEGTYTKFHFSTNKPILVSKNLKEYETILEPLGFLRTHHSYLANPVKITMYDKTDGGMLILEGGHTVPVSQRKRDTVLAILEVRSH
jgi:two-component system, LytTR family, response regulator